MPRRSAPAASGRPPRRRIATPAGYDLWAPTYDATPNPVVAMDARLTLALLAPRGGERVLDAACGTGRHLAALATRGCRAVGLDLSLGMLSTARGAVGRTRLVAADLATPLPLRAAGFDAVLCTLVGEHLDRLEPVFREFARVLRPGGRLVFSVYHPVLAAAGIEANFVHDGIEYCLGARRHLVGDYETAVRSAGFAIRARHEPRGDRALAAAFPAASKFVGVPMLLVLVADRPA